MSIFEPRLCLILHESEDWTLNTVPHPNFFEGAVSPDARCCSLLRTDAILCLFCNSILVRHADFCGNIFARVLLQHPNPFSLAVGCFHQCPVSVFLRIPNP